jgi:pilus assembly protein CpaB
MDRRVLTVLVLSLVLALVVSVLFYRVFLSGRSGRAKHAVKTRDVVVATQALGIGSMLKTEQVKLAKVPADQFPAGAFEKIQDVLDRPVASPILAEEPIREGRLAARGAGFGLAPMIAPGMRAVAVKVDEVVGVAGFVLPGMRVDVLLTGQPPGGDRRVTRTVLQNIVVLTAGQSFEPDSRGKAINAPVVTLLVTPQQAETLTLSGSEGRVQLVLRNGADQIVEPTPGRDTSDLYGVHRQSVTVPPRVHERRAKPQQTPPPPATRITEILVIRGNQKTTERVSAEAEATK